MTTELNSEAWTSEELMVEFQHVLETRLGILCGTDEPTSEQFCLAVQEADETIERLKGQTK